jgi:broad specificity phosphatase PhoE
MKITFIRHGKTLVEPEKPIVLWGLSEQGILGVQSLAGSAAVKGIDVLYASLQTKAIETMLHLAKSNAIPMRTHNGLAEVSSFTGPFTTGADYENSIKDYYAGRIGRIAGGETISEATGRFTAAIDEIVAANPDAGNIGIVTHGYILSFATAEYCGKEPIELHHTIGKPDIAVVDWETKQLLQPWGDIQN